MIRVLMLIGLAWLIYLVFRRVVAYTRATSHHRNTSDPAQENMVRCTRCGAYVPESETELVGQQRFCKNALCKI